MIDKALHPLRSTTASVENGRDRLPAELDERKVPAVDGRRMLA